MISMDGIYSYPIWYFYRNGESDLENIIKCLRHIPAEHQYQISREYEAIYLKDGHAKVSENRARANKFLGDKARDFSGDRIVKKSDQAKKEEVENHQPKQEKKPDSFVGYKPKTKVPNGMGIKL